MVRKVWLYHTEESQDEDETSKEVEAEDADEADMGNINTTRRTRRHDGRRPTEPVILDSARKF